MTLPITLKTQVWKIPLTTTSGRSSSSRLSTCKSSRIKRRWNINGYIDERKTHGIIFLNKLPAQQPITDKVIYWVPRIQWYRLLNPHKAPRERKVPFQQKNSHNINGEESQFYSAYNMVFSTQVYFSKQVRGGRDLWSRCEVMKASDHFSSVIKTWQ